MSKLNYWRNEYQKNFKALCLFLKKKKKLKTKQNFKPGVKPCPTALFSKNVESGLGLKTKLFDKGNE